MMHATSAPRTIVRRLLVALAATAVLTATPGVRAAPTAEAPAADTVVVVVSAENPVTEMSWLHLADLYLGRTSSLPNGGSAEPIDQEPGSQIRREFYETYLGRSQSEIKAHWSKAVFTGRGRPPRDVESGQAMKEFLAENPRAVGYIDRRLVDDSVRVVRVTGRE